MAVGLKKMGKPSPVKFWQVAAIQAGAAILGGLIGSRARRREQRRAREAMQTSRDAYMQQEYTNPYADMENPYEDLTINQQQAQFQAQQGAQQRADILEGLRGTAGGAGVAGLAQAMAGQAALGTQRISASIGQQEARNQRLRAQGAMQVSRLEGYGEQMRSTREQQRMETLYGMDMSRLTAANQARQKSRQNMISGLGQAAGSLAGGMAREGMFSGGTSGMGSTTPPPPPASYSTNYPTYNMDPNQLGNRPNVTIDPHAGFQDHEIDLWGKQSQKEHERQRMQWGYY